MSVPQKIANRQSLTYEFQLEDPEFSEFMNQLLTLSNVHLTSSQITTQDLQKIVLKFQGMLNTSAPSFTVSSSQNLGTYSASRAILVIGSLGIINHQLKLALTKMGFTIMIVKSLDEAMEEFKNKDYAFAVIDLFMPTDREGFDVLDEIKKAAIMSSLSMNIIVLSNAVSNEKKLEMEASARGANLFLIREGDWLKKMMHYMDEMTQSS